MAHEVKKRLLISKWRVRALALGTDPDENIAKLLNELDEAHAEIRELQDDRDEYADRLEQALERVKYWFHDGLVHGKLVSDPRRVLRTVEEALQ